MLIGLRICPDFIVPEVVETDSMALLETRTRGQTKQGKQKKKGKNAGKNTKYVFNTRITTELAYINYFSPYSQAEYTMLELKKPAKVRLFRAFLQRALMGFAG